MSSARKLADKLNGARITIATKAGENGKLFGSITTKDIADKIEQEHKVQVDRKKIVLPDAIKSIGDYDIELKLYTGVSATIKVQVVNQE